MTCTARAPGKLVVLGEYAVLDGVPALVMAVNRYCHASVRGADSDECCTLVTRTARAERTRFDIGAPSGSALVEAVRRNMPAPRGAWHAEIDTHAFYSRDTKLGLGSSAAALVAFAGAYAAHGQATSGSHTTGPALTISSLISMHRAFQGGAGSGLDVAAALTGGVIEFRLENAGMPHIGSVRLPNSVGFAGVFAGRSASTPDLVAHYRHWAETPAATELKRRMGGIAAQGLAAAREDDSTAFLTAVSEYGRCLATLGTAMGAEILTAAHRDIEAEAGRFGVAYKVSGAGGGDVGLAFADDAGALAAFVDRIAERGFQVVNMAIDEQGLVFEELAS